MCFLKNEKINLKQQFTMKIKLLKNLNGRNLAGKTLWKSFAALILVWANCYGLKAQITAGFELDGNATSVLPNPPEDWDKIYNGTGSAQVSTNVVADNDNVFMGGGSKDYLDINNWGWTTSSVPDKDDILHGGVALYNNCKLYFFADRFATNGSSNIGFWLFKNSVSITAGGTFSGIHSVGDLLLVSEFVNGGGTSVIKAYKWVGSGGNTNGTLDSVPVTGTNSFAITNSSSTASPWPFVPKTGPVNIFGSGAFFEGGIDLCSIPGLDPCFSSFLVETRSSFEVSAVLKDFLSGSFTSSPSVALSGGSRCINGPAVTLTPSVTGGILPYTYSWSPGGSTASSITVSPTVTTTYTVTVTGVNGCTKTATATVTVNPLPNVSAGADKLLTCLKTSVTLNGSSTTAGTTFNWSTSGGNIVSGGNTATPIANAAGTYVVTATSPEGCTATDTVNVTFNGTAPNVNAGADMTLTCSVTSVSLNGSSTSSVSYSWTTIGGNIVSGATTASPVVNAAGTYILTVTNPSNGCTASDTAMVILNNTLPNVNAGIDKTLTCSVTSISLNGSSSTGGALYSWTTIGGNIVSGGSTTSPTVNAAGTYILTVTNPANGCTAKDTAFVMLNNTAPDVHAGIDTLINCYNTSIVLNGSSATPGALYSWATVTGTIVSGGSTAHPTVSAAGTYMLTVTDPANGCTASDMVAVTTNFSTPNVNAGPDKVLTCSSTSVTLDGSSSTAGAVYLWTAINGGAIFSGGNTATPLVQVPGTYILTVTNPVNGCSASDSANVTQDINAPNANAGADMVLNCSVTALTLNGSTSTSNTIYSWSTLDGNIVSGGSTLSPVINAAGTYMLTVTDTVNGCQSLDAAVVILNNTPPSVSAGLDATLTCATTSIVLTGSSSTSGALFSWTTADGNIVAGGSTPSPTVNADGTYVLTVIDPSNGCTMNDSVDVSLNITPPNVNAGADAVINCLNETVSLNGSSSTAGVSFSWSTGAGVIVSGAGTASAIVSAGGSYVLTVTDSVNGCMASDTVNVLMNITPPDVNAGPDTTLNCVVTQVNLSGSSSTPGAVFLWVATNGGVIVSGANTATPLVQIPGTYILTVTNPVSGCTASDSAEVYYDNTVPNVNAGADMMLNCAVSSLNLDGFSTTPGAIISWSASAGGNIVSGGTTLNPTVDLAGTYIITVTHPTSGCTATDTAEVTLNITVPDVDAGSDTLIGCGIANLTLHGYSSANVGYNWTTASGNIISGDNTADPVVNAAGVYVLTVIDRINGCSAMDSVTIGSGIPPVVDLGNDTAVVFCTGSVMLDAGNPGMNYLWSTGDTTQTISVAASGTYYVTVTNNFDCAVSDTINVTVNPSIVNVDLGNDTTFMNCHALPFVLDAGNSGSMYLWSTTQITQTIVVTTSGTYYVTVTDSLGCMATDSINITIIDNNVDIDLGPDTTVCGCIQLNATFPGATSYMWCGGQIYPAINVCSSGTYCVTVSNGTCIDSDTVNITVLPDLIVNLGNDTSLVAGSLVLNAGNAGATFLWSTSETTQMITVTADGQYYVTVTNAAGCVETDTINVGVVDVQENMLAEESMNIYPNPSVDKTFTLEFINASHKDVEITIMNVLGEVVYSEKIPDFAGTFKKTITLKDAASGVYFTTLSTSEGKKIHKIILE
jgi:hypothetical protein